jgi:hypothetical protein
VVVTPSLAKEVSGFQHTTEEDMPNLGNTQPVRQTSSLRLDYLCGCVTVSDVDCHIVKQLLDFIFSTKRESKSSYGRFC